MNDPLRLPADLIGALRCPACAGPLVQRVATLTCQQCGLDYPVVAGRPILVCEQRSLFRIADVLSGTADVQENARRKLRRLVPDISANWGAAERLATFRRMLLTRSSAPTILVVGSGLEGEGMARLIEDARVRAVTSDVYLGAQVDLVCDGHDLPFADACFDAVVVQAVLEHVVDPARCVAEIHRVLRPAGLVYAETPFMQQVHLGCYDFTRFTELGHRWLFRAFRRLDSGLSGGPAMVLAWSWLYFVLSPFSTAGSRRIARVFALLTAFWLKYLDKVWNRLPGAADGASGFYFVGERTETPLRLDQLLAQYRGLVEPRCGQGSLASAARQPRRT